METIWRTVILCIIVPLYQANGETCAGCPSQVTELSESQQKLVDWAVVQLQGTQGQCKKNMVKVENFSTQVVAGTLSKFDLVLEHHSSNPGYCKTPESGTESCSLTVWEKPWEDFREIKESQSNCVRPE